MPFATSIIHKIHEKSRTFFFRHRLSGLVFDADEVNGGEDEDSDKVMTDQSGVFSSRGWRKIDCSGDESAQDAGEHDQPKTVLYALDVRIGRAAG